MSTFSSDRVGETIIPDLTKRFRRGYIDYFDRKNGTDRPVEEIPTRSIIPLDQFEELMKLLDDIVLFSAATPELATKFQGLWNRLDLPDKDDKDPDRMYAHGAYLVRILHQGLHLPAVRQRRPAAADRRGETGPRLHPQQSLRPVPGREIGSVRRPVRGSVRHAAPLPERNHALPERHRRL